MWHEFTAASRRALSYASGWTSGNECDELRAAPLLAGLLAQPECRAAAMLARLAIDIAAVRSRWPYLIETYVVDADLRSSPPSVERLPRFSQEVDISLELARQRLYFLPQPLELATEHILLGLATADHEVSVWLRERGLDPELLEAEIYKLNGCEPPATWTVPPPIPCPAAPAPRAAATLRILDAAGNRAREGLRVIEDYVRFVLDDRHLTELCKRLRHDLNAALSQVPIENRLAARETQADVGTTLTTAGEQQRADAAEVLAANFSRVQESLRSLEEFGKTVDEVLAAAFKDLRYRTYTLQRAIDITRSSFERLAGAKLYVLIDGRGTVDEFEQLARSLILAGVDVLQLRDKRLSDRELIERARALRVLTRDGGCPDFRGHRGEAVVGENGTVPIGPNHPLIIVNDRPDIAVLAGADGVHVGQEELSVKDARSVVGPEMLIGVSTHSIEQARQAVLDGANYIGVGPTFPSGTKQFEHFPGLDLLRQVAAEIRLPAFAIGGISRENLADVLSTGITGIAVSGAVLDAPDPRQALIGLKNHLQPIRDDA